jgi:ADP-L-glycero-D-manno-heptose 6-epimerase
MNRVLITGTKGFIGNALKKRFLNDEHVSDIVEINEDIFENSWWKEAFFNIMEAEVPDVVFHVGACSDTLETDVNYMMTRNFESTRIIADWCRRNEVPLIYSSSAASYGINGLHPANLYGWSKYVAENCVIANNGVALRYFNVYGPGEEHKGKMASVVYQMHLKHLEGEVVKLFPRNPLRDFVYIDDVVEANIVAWDKWASARGKFYDVASFDARSFEDAMKIMEIPFEYHEESAIPEGYQFFTCGNPQKKMEGWAPKFTLETGLKAYKNYLLQDR